MSKRVGVLAVVLGSVLLASPPAARADEVTTDMSQGGITFKSGNNSLTIGAYVQPRVTVDDRQDFDADTSGLGVGREDGLSSAFKVQRMRLFLKGGMFKPWLKYGFEFEFSDTSGSKDNKIKDSFLEVAPRPIFGVRAGQFKVPFSLQQLTSDTRQEFVDRAITDGKFAPARDQGVMFTGVTEKKKFGYAAGVFNGGGEANPQDDQGLMYVGRVWYDPFGEYKLSESASDLPDKQVLHAGFATRTGEAIRGTPNTGVFENPDNESSYEIDLVYKLKRIFATGEYYAMTDERQNPRPTGPNPSDPNLTILLPALPDIRSTGWHVQAGYMITSSLEAALRYAVIDPDTKRSANNVTELRGVMGYYFKGHNLKLQGDVGTTKFEEGIVAVCGANPSALECRGMPTVGTIATATVTAPQRLGGVKDYTDWQYRVQLQLAF